MTEYGLREAKNALEACALIFGGGPDQVETKIRKLIDEISYIEWWLALPPERQHNWNTPYHIVFHKPFKPSDAP